MRIFITAFGAFGDFQENPSVEVAKAIGLPFEVLEVSYRAVDEFVSNFDDSAYDAWIQIGVSGKVEIPHLELVGRNAIGETPDVRGEVHGPGLIEPSGPAQFGGTLWPSVLDRSEGVGQSVDAGSYLCNYLYYSSLRKLPNLKIGFVHIPPANTMDVEDTAQRIQRIITDLSAKD